MRLQIISDGDGTRIVNADTGEVLENVIAVQVNWVVGTEAALDIRIAKVECRVVGDTNGEPLYSSLNELLDSINRR